MRALLRRSNSVPDKGHLAFHDIEMDLSSHRVSRNGRRVHLGPTEFRLLEFFMQHPRRVFSREELLDAVWGHDIHVEPRTVDVHIRRLRKSMNTEGRTRRGSHRPGSGLRAGYGAAVSLREGASTRTRRGALLP